MGGNLAKTNIRIDKELYNNLFKIITNKLKEESIIYKEILYYKEKETFGDLDILICNKINFYELKYILESLDFKIKDYFPSKTVDSFIILLNKQDTFQIDFIKVAYNDLNIASFYFSYNDLNNLVGKLYRTINFKFGFNGLYYKHYYENQKFEILISKKPKDIYEAIGLSYTKYLNGFNKLEDIFNFVVSSPLFYKNAFILEGLNHKTRKRESKRKTYQKFLSYIKEKDFTINKENKIEEVISYFPYINLKRDIHLINKSIKNKIKIKEKINGNTIIDINPDINKREIGSITEIIKEELLIHYLENINTETLKNFIKIKIKEYEL